jgi:hypothetical protein
MNATLDPTTLKKIAELYADRVGPGGYMPVTSWRSRTALLHRLTASDGGSDDLVVKSRADWDASTVERSHREHELWRSALGDAGLAGRVSVPATRWLAEPPTLCIDFVSGVPLSQAVAARATSAALPSEVGTVLRAAGGALAGYHEAPAVAPGDDDAGAAETDVRELVARLRLPTSAGRVVLGVVRPVTSAADFAPYNLHLGDDGIVHVLDPSLGRQVVTRHRNVAWFVFWLHHRLRAAPVSFRRAAEHAFIAGYAGPSGVDLGVGADRRLLDAFHTDFASRRARSCLPGDPRRAVQLLGWSVTAWVRASRGRRPIGVGES